MGNQQQSPNMWNPQLSVHGTGLPPLGPAGPAAAGGAKKGDKADRAETWLVQE